jgi:hypothetical protein
MNFGLLSLLVLMGFLALFAGIVIWMTLHERARQAAKRQEFTRLGYAPVALPRDDLYERFDTLYRRSPAQRFDLRAVYEHRVSGGTFLFFDLVETSGQENTYLGTNAIAVISQDLHLPRAAIFGRLSPDGKTAAWMMNMASKVIEWASRQRGLQTLNLEEFPRINDQLIVLADNEQAARAFFSPDRLERLVWLGETTRMSMIDCLCDMFVLQRQTTQTRPNLEQELPALIRDANSAWMALQQ